MNLPLQIKDDARLRILGSPASFTLDAAGRRTLVAIDGRVIPVAALSDAPVEAVAKAVARVPRSLRDVLKEIAISPNANPADAFWSNKYQLPVLSGMGAVASGSGQVVIYPHGIGQLTQAPDGDGFVRGLMHELGHCWSLADWNVAPAQRDAWLDAIVGDSEPPSLYASWSFRNAGTPDEDVAESTALYFLVLGTPAFDAYRDAMPKRFALLDARFERGNTASSNSAHI